MVGSFAAPLSSTGLCDEVVVTQEFSAVFNRVRTRLAAHERREEQEDEGVRGGNDDCDDDEEEKEEKEDACR